MPSSVFIWIVLLIIFGIYISYYYRHPEDITILQTTLSNFYFDMLREKQPIIIEDKVVSVGSLVHTWFKQNFSTMFSMQSSLPNNPKWIKNVYKFTIIHATEQCEIMISSAKDVPNKNIMPENATIVALRLAANQSVIVPYRMHYAITHNDSKNIQCVGIHDLMTKFLP